MTDQGGEIMGDGSFFKGEKKKKKKGGQMSGMNFSPVFTPPQVIGKGKEKNK